jgi:hypothetical protein
MEKDSEPAGDFIPKEGEFKRTAQSSTSLATHLLLLRLEGCLPVNVGE